MRRLGGRYYFAMYISCFGFGERDIRKSKLIVLRLRLT